METILHLEFPDFHKKHYDFIEVNSQRVAIKKNYEDIIIQKTINRNHYIEKIKLFNNTKDFVEHKIELYLKKKNNFDCFIGSKNDYTYEIFQYDKKNLIESLDITQDNITYNLKLCDNNGLKYCRRFNIINCSKECLDNEKFKIPNFLKGGSYRINMFHGNISIEKMNVSKYYEIDFNSLDENQKNYLLNLESNFNQIYNNLVENKNINDSKKDRIMEDELEEIMKKEIEFEKLDKLEIILAERRKLNFSIKEFNICYGYALFKILSAINVSKIPYSLSQIFLYYLKDLKSNIPNNFDILRIMFWYNKYYLKNSLIINKLKQLLPENYKNLRDSKFIEELHGFRLIFPNNCKKNTPYKNCYDFLYRFIDELNEDSYLLELLYLLDSDTASNRIYKNVRLFKLSLLSLSQIKEHLKLIIPDVVVRKFNSQYNMTNANYDHSCGVMQCYEGTLFINDYDYLNQILIENEDNDCKYTLPLLMLFFHELFGHAKHRLDNNVSMSPTNFYDPYNNYNLLYHCMLGESGRLVEYYISNDIKIINYLKFSTFPNKEIMSVKLWTAPDLSDLRQIVKDKIEKYNFTCEKKIENFPDPNNNIKPTLADGSTDEEYLSDSAGDFYERYDKEFGFNPYYFLYEKGSHSCM